MYLTAPIILIPENIFKVTDPILIIDTGSIEIKSHLNGYNKNADIKSIRSPTLLYDRYEIMLSHFQINILD